MQGVSTSTAGFIGLAERGPVVGQPQLVTSFADYKRMYGGYLGEASLWERPLPALCGGAVLRQRRRPGLHHAGRARRCQGSQPDHRRAEDHRGQPWRLGPGSCGSPWPRPPRPRPRSLPVNGADLTLKNADGFHPGDVVELYDGQHHRPCHHQERAGSRWSPWTPPARWTWRIPRWAPPKYIRTCEITVTARLERDGGTCMRTCPSSRKR